MKSKILGMIAILATSSSAFAGASPSSVLIKVYSILASTSTSCTNPVVVVNYGSAGKVFDFEATPDLGGGKMADGTYPCVMMQMSDEITFVPASTSGSCAAGTTYTVDVCRASNSGTYTPTTISGTTATFGTVGTSCTGTSATPGDDKVTLFLTTTGTTTNGGGGGGQAFDNPAGDVRNGFKLNGALIVTGSGGGQFVTDFTGKLNGSGAACDLDPPTFSFR